MAISTVYLRTIFYPEIFPRTIEKTLAAARALKEEYGYDTIAFCGMSGAAMAFILAYELEIPLLCVRKETDDSHFHDMNSGKVLEGNIDTQKYLIVDDFISSGRTLNYIMDSIQKGVPGSDCVAMLMYAATSSNCTYSRKESGRAWKVISSRPEGTL
jgi:adenine/guanine phosphoribosyltransferase-like PRPP-binding protein